LFEIIPETGCAEGLATIVAVGAYVGSSVRAIVGSDINVGSAVASPNTALSPLFAKS